MRDRTVAIVALAAVTIVLVGVEEHGTLSTGVAAVSVAAGATRAWMVTRQEVPR